MTIKEIAEILAEQGHNIKIRKRSDGGYIISGIDSERFSGASGNIRARQIVGATLSAARSYQLARIRPPKNVSPVKRKMTPLPQELLKEMRKVQRQWRKNHPDIAGTISTKGLRYQYEKYGEEMAKASLNKAFRYSQGYAYLENVNWLIERLTTDRNKLDGYDASVIDDIINQIKMKQLSFKEDWISEIYEEIYEFEKGQIEADELARRIQNIMNS